jgi:hypothetical protein
MTLLGVCLAAGGGLPSAPAYGQQGKTAVAFTKEQVKILVGPGRICVEGTYWFSNHSDSPARQRLFYPFPMDSLHLRPEGIVVWLGEDAVPFRQMEDGVRFMVEVPAQGSTPIVVYYEQPCLERSGCYILESTVMWDVPLEHASFEIQVPDTLVLDWVSYRIDRVRKDGGLEIHEFSKDHFMPDKDLCLRWHVRPREGKAGQ